MCFKTASDVITKKKLYINLNVTDHHATLKVQERLEQFHILISDFDLVSKYTYIIKGHSTENEKSTHKETKYIPNIKKS